MEHLVKITHETKLRNSKFWMYDYRNIQTKEESFFYNYGRIDKYFLGLVGNLNLAENSPTNNCQSFVPDPVNTIKEFEKEKAFAKFVGKTDQIIKKLDNDFAKKKKKLELASEQIIKLRQEGRSWKWIADFYQVDERTIRRWRKVVCRPLQKEGRKEKVNGIDLIFLLCCALFGKKTITQQEMADYLEKERGIIIDQANICRILRKRGIIYKRNTQRYLERKPLLARIIQFMEKVKNLPQELIGAMDECGFNFGGFLRRSYSRKGLRSFIWKKANEVWIILLFFISKMSMERE